MEKKDAELEVVWPPRDDPKASLVGEWVHADGTPMLHTVGQIGPRTHRKAVDVLPHVAGEPRVKGGGGRPLTYSLKEKLLTALETHGVRGVVPPTATDTQVEQLVEQVKQIRESPMETQHTTGTGVDVEEIARRYREGTTGLMLAKEYGLHRSTIYRMLKDAGVARRPAHRPRKHAAPPRREEAKQQQAFDPIVPLPEVARQVGVRYPQLAYMVKIGLVPQAQRRGAKVFGVPYSKLGVVKMAADRYQARHARNNHTPKRITGDVAQEILRRLDRIERLLAK